VPVGSDPGGGFAPGGENDFGGATTGAGFECEARRSEYERLPAVAAKLIGGAADPSVG
jgi:hypothetical protein